ncbi:MAG: DinB family protein [Ignavibacterium sp.]|nr:MAG: DinB family protein [Ignavibacterium sp.]
MTEINYIIDCLEKTPAILNNLLNQIPKELFKIRRIKNKWCIHEQVCHLVDAQSILMERFKKFETEENPLIKSYNPPVRRSEDHYFKMNMNDELNKFPNLRKEMVEMLGAFDVSYWNRKGRHEIFSPYNTQILLTHSLNVDYAHLFSIEQLGLTKSEFEDDIITIP